MPIVDYVAQYNIDGVPSVRDVRNPCPVFAPRHREPGDWSDCEGNGHYLCYKCALFQNSDRA